MNFKNKVCVITGASAGIGNALAEQLLHEDAILHLCARRLERLEQFQKKHSGAKVFVHPVDVAKAEQMKQMMEKIKTQHGQIDLFIANAGFGVVGEFEKLSTDDYRRQFEVNVFGVLEGVRAALPLLKKSEGRIAIVGSLFSYLSVNEYSAYAMSKYAIRALSESLYHEFQKFKVSVTLICPGAIQTEFRQVDNKGNFSPEKKDPVPSYAAMSADKCAKKIIKAVKKRKREKIVTVQAGVSIYFKRFLPGLFHFFVSRLPVRAAREKKE